MIFKFSCVMLQYTKITNKMQLCRIIYCSLTALHVSSDIFAHHQEHLNCMYSFWYYSHVSLSAGVEAEQDTYRFSHHHQGVHYPSLLKLLLTVNLSVNLASSNSALPDDGVTAPKHVGAVLMSILM
jgi:hypothetical protein